MKTTLSIERLESRIAPATLANNVLTYMDSDGDNVSVKISKGTLTTGMFQFDSGGVTGDNSMPQQLRLIDLSAAVGVSGVNVAMKVVKATTGDGLAAIGRINAGANDLGSVVIAGDLGDIDAGSGGAKPAIKLLQVDSMGRFGLATQGGAGNLQGDIHGALGALKVYGSITEAWVDVFGGASAKIGSVTVGGSLIGGAGFGAITATGDIGPMKIGQDVRGGTAISSGYIVSSGKLASLTIGGSVIGGSALASASIGAVVMGPVKIGQNFDRARLDAVSLASLTIGGSLIGGPTNRTGFVSVTNDIGPVNIAHDLRGGTGGECGRIESINGKIASVTIGGSLIGGTSNAIGNDGSIRSSLTLGPVQIAHDVLGGSGFFSGMISSAGNVSSVHVGGSMIGGAGAGSGSIQSGFLTGVGDMGAVKIDGDMLGAVGDGCGQIYSSGKLASATIGGSLIGGAANYTGAILSGGDMGPVTIAGDFQGGSITGNTTDLTNSGFINGNRIAAVAIGGSVRAGTDDSTGGKLIGSASIRAVHDIGSIDVGGNVVGTVGSNGVTPVVFSAKDQSATRNLAIGSITIGGRVERATILAGYDVDLVAVNGNAQIGAVKVGGDWIASNLIAGVADGGAAGFGDAGDTIIGSGTQSKIAKITIDGLVVGTVGGSDRFGFESHAIGSFKASGFVIPVPAGPGSVALSPFTSGDVLLRLL